MSKPKEYLVGEISIYARPAVNVSYTAPLRGKGKDGTEKLLMVLFAWLDNGHLQLEDLKQRINEYEKSLEVRSNGFKRHNFGRQ